MVVELSDGGVHRVDSVVFRAPGDEADGAEEEDIPDHLPDHAPHPLLVDPPSARTRQTLAAGRGRHFHRADVICSKDRTKGTVQKAWIIIRSEELRLTFT